MNVSAQNVYEGVCPPGETPVSFPSSGSMGTSYGKYLGLMFLKERRPDPYCIIDFGVFYRGQWGNSTIYNMARSNLDPGVSLAFVNRKVAETWRWLHRTDILDAERDHVYEIKPLRSRDEGVQQLQEYIDQLNLTATVAGPIFNVSRTRTWMGGDWDPSAYPLVVPGVRGRVCLLHAWKDPQVRGLIVYDMVCCIPAESDEAETHLYLTRVKKVSKPILDSQPAFVAQLQTALAEHLPKAPAGSAYAFLVPPRVFQTYVLAPLDQELARQFDRVYSPRMGPVMTAFVLETFVLAHVLPTGVLADIAAITGGYMIPEEIYKLWAFQAAGAAIAAGVLLIGPEVAGAAAVAEVATISDALATAEAAGTVVATTETLAVTTTVPAAAASVTVDGVAYLAAGEAAAATSSLPAWMIADVGAGVGGAGATRLGLGVVGVLVTQFVAAPAQAQTLPDPAPEAGIAGADPVYLAPVELLQPKRGEITLNAEVSFGGETFFIIALAGPE